MADKFRLLCFEYKGDRMKKILIIMLMGIMMLGFVSAGSDTYSVRWIVPSNVTASPSQNIDIYPYVENKVPHMKLGEHLRFPNYLPLISLWRVLII